MNTLYYYVDGNTKKGPFTIENLQKLNLPLETLIWRNGWADNKPISECPDVMDYFVLNPPDLSTVENTYNVQWMEVHPDMHWLPKTVLYLGIIGLIINFMAAFAFVPNVTIVTIDLAFVVWAAISLYGLINKKRWGLISYFVCRVSLGVLLILGTNEGLLSGDEVLKDFISLAFIICIFLAKKDGHNVYELLWNNGVFYVEKPYEEKDLL